eukprot:431494-Rhodomonas_salina.1
MPSAAAATRVSSVWGSARCRDSSDTSVCTVHGACALVRHERVHSTWSRSGGEERGCCNACQARARGTQSVGGAETGADVAMRSCTSAMSTCGECRVSRKQRVGGAKPVPTLPHARQTKAWGEGR